MEVVVADLVIDLIMIIIPAAIVFFVAHHFTTKFFQEEREKRRHEIKQVKLNKISPLKVQAFERLTIFLDRITPENLILRNTSKDFNATQFKHKMVRSVQEEFNHNISQQLYISDQSWTMIKLAMEYVLGTIEACYKIMPENAKGTDLGKAILVELQERDQNPVQAAIQFLKKELEIVY